MQETQNKPQLHISMLDMMCRCGIQFQRRYGARFGCWPSEEIIAPGIALLTGISVHRSVEENLKEKMKSKSLLPSEKIEAIARDEFMNLWQAGVMLTDDESLDVKTTLGSNLDQTIKLARLHSDNLAPFLNPVAIEEKFVINLNGYPYDLAGTKDIREVDGTLRDTKTKAMTPPEDAARTMQMAMYCLSEKVERKKLPPKISLDFLIKTKIPKLVIREAIPLMTWIDPLLQRVERAIEIIQTVKEGKQAFTPADPESWICQERYCGFSRTCAFWSGR